MMKNIPAISLFLFAYTSVYSQQDISPTVVIQQVQRAQAGLKTAIYNMDRIDTLLTGDSRRMSGKVIIQADPADTLLGFRFWAKKDDEESEKIYDGRIGYESNPDNKTYVLINTAHGLHNLFFSGGGHLVMPDLIRLDTSKASGFMTSQDMGYYYLTVNYPDLKQYDVVKRRKIVTVSKSTMLPVAVRHHQESLGKIQDLYFETQNLQINPPATYNFNSPPFLKEYVQVIPVTTGDPRMDMIHKPIPVFELESFAGNRVSSKDFGGKVVLLDFWEVWCGPCVEGMPKIQKLYEKYKDNGFMVYGITHDLKQLSSARLLLKKRNISLVTLIGNAQTKRDYKLTSIPLYILIDKKGNASAITPSYSPDLEEMVVRLLKD